MTGAGGLGEAMRDPDEAMRRVNDWAAGFARKAERYAAAKERTEQLKLSAASPDGTVRVTVGADGVVSDLAFSAKTRTIPPDELARMVLATMRRAQAGITERVAEVMNEEIGDEDRETRAALLGALSARFDPEDPEDGPPAPPETPTPPPPPAPSSGAPAPSTGEGPAPRNPAQPGGATSPRRQAGGVDPEEADNNPW